MSTDWTEKYSRHLMTYCVRPGAVAAFFVYVALLWTLLLQQWIPYPFLFLFLGAVLGSAWFGGTIAGIVSVVLSTGVVAFFFLPPVFSFRINRESISYFISYIVSAAAISWFSSAKKRTEMKIREARDLLEQRVKERTAELERSNQEIIESERRLRELTEAIPQQIWSASPEGTVEYCNQHLLNYVGRPLESLCGGRFFDVVHPEDRQLFQQAWESARISGETFEGKWRVSGADGSYRWFLVRSRPQKSDDGRILRWYGTHIDIEERHETEQALIRAQSELARLSHILGMGELTVSIAHEINQPLTAVVTHAHACIGWLRATPANLERVRSTVERIIQEGTRAAAVVARIRALFRRETTSKQLLDVNTIIRDLVSLLRDEAIRRGVSIQLDLTGNLPNIEADRVQLEQVLLNLATNGMDAMIDIKDRPRELIIRSMKAPAGEVMVLVEDCGAGLEPGVAERIFDPFFTTKPEGLGLGLAISRSIVEAHDGRLWAMSRQPFGTVFQFTIPVQP